MTRTHAADRLADGFPHGTPRGFTDGCRGNGGCPNRNSTRMTCKEASTRYASDLAYRRAYDAGDIWLDRAEARDPEAERVRASVARRSLNLRGTASDPTRAVIDEGLAPTPKRDQYLRDQLEEAGQQISAALDRELEHAGLKLDPPAERLAVVHDTTPVIDPEADLSEPEEPEAPHVGVDALQARVAELEQQLAAATAGEQRAADLARMATQEAETARAARDTALAEAERLRGEMTATLAAARRYTPGHRASVEVYSIGEQLHVSLNALLDPQSVATLAERLGAARAS